MCVCVYTMEFPEFIVCIVNYICLKRVNEKLGCHKLYGTKACPRPYLFGIFSFEGTLGLKTHKVKVIPWLVRLYVEIIHEL